MEEEDLSLKNSAGSSLCLAIQNQLSAPLAGGFALASITK